MRNSRNMAAVALIVASIALVVMSLLVGTEHVDLGQAWHEWRAGLPPAQAPMLGIILDQRLPRTLAALIVGCGLALAGAAFQAMLRNPLAEPYTLGVASAEIPASTSRGKETFFDGKVFDPENPAAYLKSLAIKRVEV